jgi:hypothetical protein
MSKKNDKSTKLETHMDIYSALYQFQVEFSYKIDFEKIDILASRYYKKSTPLVKKYPFLMFTCIPIESVLKNSIVIKSIIESDSRLVALFKNGLNFS